MHVAARAARLATLLRHSTRHTAAPTRSLADSGRVTAYSKQVTTHPSVSSSSTETTYLSWLFQGHWGGEFEEMFGLSALPTFNVGAPTRLWAKTSRELLPLLPHKVGSWPLQQG